MTAENDTIVRWDKPGPGNWELDRAHYGPSTSRIAIDLIEDSLPRGFAEGIALVGGPFATMEAAFVHGCFYRRIVPLVGAGRDLPPPPNWLLWLITRVHPTFRRRARVARTALSDRVWQAELERWETTWKPRLLAFNREKAGVDVTVLTDAELAAHVGELYEHLRWSTALHFRLHVSDMGPIGLLLVRGREWGVSDDELMSAMAGHSPATRAPSALLDRLGRLVAESGHQPTTLAEVRAIGPDAAGLLDEYLSEFGGRVTTGYDLFEPTLGEMPGVVLASIVGRDGRGGDGDGARREGDETGARVRAAVPPAEQDEFDRLLDDARMLYGLRDENGPLTYEWPAGLLRLSLLEAARRLVSSGRVAEIDHVFDLHADEVVALLGAQPGPSAEAITERHRVRLAQAQLEPPSWLGRVEEPPPLWVLPGPMATLMEVTFAVLALLEAEHRRPLAGVGVGERPERGVARVVLDATDALERVEPGDIVVAPFTVPTYNSVLAMAGGVVVEHGGLLCHTAVIAREFGIPAVVGVAGATRDISDGALIEIDPVAGEVRLIG